MKENDPLPPALRKSIDAFMTSSHGRIFIAYLATRMHIYDSDSSQEARILREFMISLLGEMNLYATDSLFQKDVMDFLTNRYFSRHTDIVPDENP